MPKRKVQSMWKTSFPVEWRLSLIRKAQALDVAVDFNTQFVVPESHERNLPDHCQETLCYHRDFDHVSFNRTGVLELPRRTRSATIRNESQNVRHAAKGKGSSEEDVPFQNEPFIAKPDSE
jgi:hypothetical protein